MTHELKSLQGQRDKTRQIINTYEEDIKKKNLELKEKKIELNEIMTAIKNIENNNDVVISEHAILRYLERVKGFNLEDIKNEMLDARTRQSLKVVPVNKIKRDGYNLIIKNKVIITVTL